MHSTIPMTPVFTRIRQRARQIAAHLPSPAFYTIHEPANRRSLDFFETDRVISKLKARVAARIEDNFGHGMDHAVKVTIDAGALMIIESVTLGRRDEHVHAQLRLVQTAGLLHDIKRKYKNHAEQGAVYARKVLADFSFNPGETDDICHAIRSHEAFTHRTEAATPEGELVSACLYDADKFRWGPDNFNHTIWDMVAFSSMSLGEFIEQYPKGMEGLERIKHTFRTRTGKVFGPQFIELGIDIGNQLFHVIQTEFGNER